MSSFGATSFLFICVLVSGCVAGSLDFPAGFKFGAATASYQVEGAWNVSDKGVNIWDHYTHEVAKSTADGSTGDVACDSYHQWRRDVEMAKELGLDFYRFSLSWTRLLPSGLPNKISEDGKNYYNNLINGLLAEGIEPVVTIFHWDLPQNLQDLGGWSNPLQADWLTDFARVAFELFDDRVKTWLTINEPVVICTMGYNVGAFPPNIRSPDVAYYLCNKHVLLAHAKVWRLYDEEYRGRFGGRISIVNHMFWYEPETEDMKEAAEDCSSYFNGMFSFPIYSKDGGWPPVAKKLKPGPPAFTKEEIQLIRGTYDFFGYNGYTGRLVSKPLPGQIIHPWPIGAPMFNAVIGFREEWATTPANWFRLYPEGLRKQLNWVKNSFNNPEILITENGFVTRGSNLDDVDRVQFYKDHLKQVLLAIHEDEVNVSAYTAWTLMDNFEWTSGYDHKFGLYEVDFNSPQRTRTPRRSAKFYADVIKRRSHKFGLYEVDFNSPQRTRTPRRSAKFYADVIKRRSLVDGVDKDEL